MNATALTNPSPTDPKELRPLLHAEVDRLPDGYLEKTHRLLLEMEIQWLMAMPSSNNCHIVKRWGFEG